MTDEQLKSILKSRDLRVTKCRKEVMNLFLVKQNALSLGDLENNLTKYDRVTLYRTLITFLEAGILHKIPNEDGNATYGLCHETCGPDHHEHNHIHFKCNNCGHMECIEDKEVPKVTVPDGYRISGINLIVDGMCAKCT